MSPNGLAAPVAVIGDAYCDLIYSGSLKSMPAPGLSATCDGFEIRAGGSAAYTAMALASLRIPVEVVVQIGQDVLSSIWLKQVCEAKVGTGYVKVITSARIGVSCVFLLPNERSFITFPGANSEPFCSLPKVTTAKFSLVYVTGFMQVPGFWQSDALTDIIRFLKNVKTHGIPIFLDTNYDSSEKAMHAVRRVLPWVDVFLPNASELRLISDTYDLEAACRLMGVPSVIVKLGKEGCFVYSRTMPCSQYVRTDAASDPTDVNGAGDFWAAGLIANWLTTKNLVTAGEFANKVASAAIGSATLPTKIQHVEMIAG